MAPKNKQSPRPMTAQAAIKFSIETLELKRGEFIFDANLYGRGLITPNTEHAAQRVLKINRAIETLKILLADCEANP
jgi:hypothetical protein